MKITKALGIITAALALGSFGMNAQTTNGAQANKCPNQTKNCPATTECVKMNQCNACPANGCDIFFEGITLTPEQKAKINDLRMKRMSENKKNMKQSSMQRDSVAKARKKEHLNNMKQILEPEQYVMFLENMVVNRPQGMRNGKKMAHHRMHHNNGKMQKGNMVNAQKANKQTK